MEGPRWVLNMNIDVLLCRIPPWSPGLCGIWSRAPQTLHRNVQLWYCYLIVLIMVWSGTMGRLAEEISDKHKHKHSLHDCRASLPGYWAGWLEMRMMLLDNMSPINQLSTNTTSLLVQNTDNHIKTFYHARIQRIRVWHIFISYFIFSPILTLKPFKICSPSQFWSSGDSLER